MDKADPTGGSLPSQLRKANGYRSAVTSPGTNWRSSQDARNYQRPDAGPGDSPASGGRTGRPRRPSVALAFDFPDHEIVALSVRDSQFVDWRFFAQRALKATNTVSIGVEQLTRIAKIAKLYPTYATELWMHGKSDTLGVKIGPINGALKTAEAVNADEQAQSEQAAREDRETAEAAYDEAEDED